MPISSFQLYFNKLSTIAYENTLHLTLFPLWFYKQLFHDNHLFNKWLIKLFIQTHPYSISS